MDVFHRMAYMAAARLMGTSAGRRITNEQLAGELEQVALSDPELAEHYARLAAAVPAWRPNGPWKTPISNRPSGYRQSTGRGPREPPLRRPGLDRRLAKRFVLCLPRTGL